MATSPGDETKGDVLGWLEKLESSIRSDKQFAASPSIPGASSPPSPSTIANTADTNPYLPGNKERDDALGKETTGALSFARKHYPSLSPPEEHHDEGDTSGSETEDEDGSDKVEDGRSTLPDSTVPLGLLATLSLADSAGGGNAGHGHHSDTSGVKKKEGKEGDATKESEEDLGDERVGVANEGYFQPGPAVDLGKRAMLIEQHSPPEILVHGLVAPKDVDILFQTFFEKVNPFLGLLDPVLHTPATTFARCPFLFTVICAVSSRYYPPKAEIYPIAMHFAKHAAANALIDGWKTVELCQAYILMSVYAVPARKWEEDRSWLYTGLAIRIATDLNLHRTPTVKTSTARSLTPATPSSVTSSGSSGKREKEIKEREILNRTRIWMICFNMDRSTATQFGKPTTIKDDFITLACGEFYMKSPWNDPYDIHLCAYTALLQVVSKFQAELYSDPRNPTGLNKKLDFRAVTLAHDANLTNYHEEWSRRFQEQSDPNDPSCRLRTYLLPFLVAYSRLVMFSFGFQQAFHRGMKEEDKIFFTKCLESAKQVIKVFIEKLVPTGYMRYSPDGHFVFTSFASAFLLKLLRPEFSTFLPQPQAHEIFELIGKLIQTLSSGDLAIDDRHTPKLYARFLAGLLSRYKRAEATPAAPHSYSQGMGSGGSGSGGAGGPLVQFGSGQGLHQFSLSAGGTALHGHSQHNYGGYTGGSGYTHATNLNSTSAALPPTEMTSQQVHSQSQPPGVYSAPSSDSESTAFTPPDTTSFQPLTTIVVSDAEMAPPMAMQGNGAQQEQPQYLQQQNEEATLAAMYALKNPAWWDNMMMPGFSWPESPYQSLSPQSSGATPPHQSQPTQMHLQQTSANHDPMQFGQYPAQQAQNYGHYNAGPYGR